MKIHSLKQGAEAWHEFRLQHFGASEAAAMLGLSKKVTRTELLHMKKTGAPREFSEWFQKNVLDKGHEVEALARPIVEEMFEIDLYPVTVSEGKLSASCDGATLTYGILFEHKQWNRELAESVLNGVLPEEYMPQPQQQLMVTGAEKVIFTVSDGTRENMVSMEVFPDPEWFERIRAGWAQFERDLSDYVPVEVIEKPEPEAIMGLPALSIQTSGSISIVSNLDSFSQKLHDFVDNLDTAPTTDQGFANAEQAIKVLQKAQDALEAAESSALAQAGSIDELRRTIGMLQDLARSARLTLEKAVKVQKEKIRNDIVKKGQEAFYAHIWALETEISPVKLIPPLTTPNLWDAIKNKRTLASLRDAVDTALANGKIAADAAAKAIREQLAWYRETAKGYEFLFSDLAQIAHKPADDFRLLVESRIMQRKENEAAERRSIEEEAFRKAEAERERIREQEEKRALLLARQAVAGAQRPEPVPAQQPVKRTVSSDALQSIGSQPNVQTQARLISARNEARLFRQNFRDVKELVGVMREIDLFLMEETA